MIGKDFYKILNISPNSSQEEIKKAYKRLAIKYHPDHNPNNPLAVEKFKEINEAYENLNHNKQSNNDNNNDKNYDFDFDTMFNNTSFNFKEVENEDNLFNSFNNYKKYYYNSKENYNLNTTLELTLKEAILGTNKELNINYQQICEACKGLGKNLSSKKSCYNCKSIGIVIKNYYKGNIKYIIQQECPVCKGTGYSYILDCNICNGKGKIKGNKLLNVKISEGVDNNEIIKLKGKGLIRKSDNFKGDLFIKIKVKSDKLFTRKKNNLYYNITVDFIIATLGGKINITTLNGEILRIKIPSGSQHGDILKIKNKGVTSLKNSIRGDLICTIKIIIPKNLNSDQKKLLEKLSLSINKN